MALLLVAVLVVLVVLAQMLIQIGLLLLLPVLVAFMQAADLEQLQAADLRAQQDQAAAV